MTLLFKGNHTGNCSMQEGGKACRKEHNHLVHGANVQFVNALKSKQEDQMLCGKNTLKADDSGDLLLKFQDISVKNEDTRVSLVFWDNGSTVSD